MCDMPAEPIVTSLLLQGLIQDAPEILKAQMDPMHNGWSTGGSPHPRSFTFTTSVAVAANQPDTVASVFA